MTKPLNPKIIDVLEPLALCLHSLGHHYMGQQQASRTIELCGEAIPYYEKLLVAVDQYLKVIRG